MTREFPSEIYIGTTVWFYVEPLSPPIASQVIDLDYDHGCVQIQPIGYQPQFTAQPYSICDHDGHILTFKNNDFFFSDLIRG
jgi:hypothetical protein